MMMQLLTELKVFLTPLLVCPPFKHPSTIQLLVCWRIKHNNNVQVYAIADAADVVEHMQAMIYDCSIDLQVREVFTPILSVLDLYR